MTTAVPLSKTRSAIAVILAVSAAATAFLFWLIYVHPATDQGSVRFAFLPALNAALNGLSAMALLIGYTFIRARRIPAHRAAMLTAFGFSTLFLVSYILHHALHGDVRYPVHAALRSVYLPLLASHIILAVVALPLGCPLDLPAVALRIAHRRHYLGDAAPGAMKQGIGNRE